MRLPHVAENLTVSTFEVVSDAEAAYTFCRQYFDLGPCVDSKGICLKRNGETIAAVVFDNWNGSNVFMHCAAVPGKKWLNRHFLHEAFKHPFVTLGCKRITLWIEKTNVASRIFASHLGFTHEATLDRAAQNGGDVVLYRLFREDCRYA